MNPKEEKATRREANGREVREVTGIGPGHDMA